MSDINSRLARAPIVPLVQANDPDVAVATTRALAEGGLTVIEVVLRTEAALECLSAISEMDDDLIVGAGTVLSGSQATEVLERGANDRPRIWEAHRSSGSWQAAAGKSHAPRRFDRRCPA